MYFTGLLSFRRKIRSSLWNVSDAFWMLQRTNCTNVHALWSVPKRTEVFQHLFISGWGQGTHQSSRIPQCYTLCSRLPSHWVLLPGPNFFWQLGHLDQALLPNLCASCHSFPPYSCWSLGPLTALVLGCQVPVSSTGLLWWEGRKVFSEGLGDPPPHSS